MTQLNLEPREDDKGDCPREFPCLSLQLFSNMLFIIEQHILMTESMFTTIADDLQAA